MTFNGSVFRGRKTAAASKIAEHQIAGLSQPETVVREMLKELGYGYRLLERINCGTSEADDAGTEPERGTPRASNSCDNPQEPRQSTKGNRQGAKGGAGAYSTFTIDLYVPEHKICVEVDGPYHRTAKQERKTAWRDAQLIANGYKVLHIDSAYTEPRWKPELARMLPIAMKDLIGGKQTVRIIA